MEDSLTDDRRAIYIRIGRVPDGEVPGDDSGWTGLFTRPAVLALQEELSRHLPIRALNRACRMLLDLSPVESADITVSEVARECGFEDREEFSIFFRQATGWKPVDWLNRFGRV